MAAPEEIAQAYIDAMEGLDVDRFRPLLADDFALVAPYNLTGTNDPDEPDSGDVWRGKEKAFEKFEQAFRNRKAVKFRDVDISPTTKPDVVFIEAWGDITMPDGSPYNNLYVFRLDLQDGKILKCTEYRNPITSAIAFARPLPWQTT